MDFDFNIILVPLTLFFGFLWLLDILWLKRRNPSESKGKQAINTAQTDLTAAKQRYKEVLNQHNIAVEDVDTFSMDDAPVPVKQAERDYREAKRQANISNSQHVSKESQPHFLIRWARDYFPVLAIVLIVRSFIIEPFNIPSSSMVPTLYTGDFVAVKKYAYGIRLPLIYNKVLDTGSPEHGDVAVFRYPDNPKIYFIKRVIGLPGDTVSYDKGQLAVNGEVVPSESVNFEPNEALVNQLYTPVKSNEPGREWQLSPQRAIEMADEEEQGARYFKEQLGDHTYTRRYLVPSLQGNNYAPFLGKEMAHGGKWEVTVPEGNYFVMGDNSDRSDDSRYWGFVPDENLSGKAVYVWMHKKPGLKNLPTFGYNRPID